MTFRLKTLLALPVLALACLATNAAAQAYPTKQVRVIVPFAAGGGTDAIARMIGQKLAEKWGQSVVVENKAGGDGIIGTEFVARAAGDGYTLVFLTPSHAINPVIKPSIPYDTLKDFAHITELAETPFVIVANKDGGSTVAELTTRLKANPGKMGFGSADPSSRLAGELFNSIGGVQMFNVPYKGSGQVLLDVAGGHLSVGFVSLASAVPFHKQGTARILGVGTTKRSPMVPEVPTLIEAGLPGYDFSAWYGYAAPSATPAPVIKQLQADIAAVAALPEVREGLLRLGATTVASTPEQFTSFVQNQIARTTRIVKSGIKLE